MKLLILTDHTGHSRHNSLYPLVEAFSRFRQGLEIRIASRGWESNRAFFSGGKGVAQDSLTVLSQVLEQGLRALPGGGEFDYEARRGNS